MATLISSKQIQGVVTASVIQGDFFVSGGMVDFSNAMCVSGSFTGSFKGDGSQITFGGTGIVSGSSQITISQTTGFSAFSSSLDSKILTQKNRIDAILDSADADKDSFAEIVTLINSVDTTNDIAFANHYTSSRQRLTSLESFTSSIDTTIKTKLNTEDVLSGSIESLLPSGVVSGSSQITFSGLSGKPSGLVSSSAQITDGSGILSGSIVDQLPSGIISGSTFTSFSSSVDSRLDTLENATDNTGSDTQTLSISGDQLTISSGNTITIPTGSGGGASSWSELSGIPTGLISGSTFTDFSSSVDLRIVGISASGSGADWNTNLQNIPTGIVSGSVLRSLDGTGVVSGSVLRTLDGSGVLSASVDFNTYSASVATTIDNIQHTQIPSGVISGSTFTHFSSSVDSRLDTLENQTDNTGSDSQTLSIVGDQLTISGGNTVTLPSGSGGGTSDFTQLTNVPSGLVSGSSQITDGSGIVSGSVIRTLAGSGIVSQSAQISAFNTFLEINGDGVVSGSVVRTLDGTGVVSGSVLRTLDGTGVVSGSVLRTLGGTDVVSGSVVRTLDGTNIFSGSIIGQGNITITSGSGNITISGSAAQVTYNGNRIVSNEDLGDLFTNNFNAGTTGSITEFLNAIFFPNTAPSITTGNQTIEEYRTSGASIVTLSGTDAEGQSLTWGTSSAYTDDLVRVASNGAMTLNALAESSSFNTDSVGAGHGHLVTVTATDTFSETTEKDIYIIVTPNQAPKFRETSIAGNVITSVTSNLNENSSNGTLVKRIFFTDAESDSITIYSSSISPVGGATHFTITKNSTYVDITQNTGSLDYENITQYTLSISASDEHYEGGQDSDSITTLPITINVTDNLAPTVNNQVVGSINENSSNGTVVGIVSVSDNEGDSVSAPYFQLHKLYLDGIEVSTGSYGGTSQATDPHENAFEINSGNRQITRKTGVYLNSDLVNRYDYRIKVRDEYNQQISSASVVTINITDDTAATLSDNWSAGPYIKESELSGTTIKTTNYGATTADYNSNQSGTWSSSNSAISINSSGNLSLGVDLSGSVTQSGDTLDSTITFTNSFGTTTTDNLSVTIVANSAPTATFSNQSSNLNANLATTNTNLVLVTITDTESDTPYSASLSGTDASKLNLSYQNSNSSSVYIRANENLSAATYNYNIRVTDNYGKSTDYNSRTITIASPDTGTLTGDTTSYIIESAVSGALIRESSNGRTGNQADLDVSYSPNYGSQAVQSFTSSLSQIVVSNTGLLSLNVDLSGSATSSGDTITPTITWRDQYDNVGSSTITINVAENQAPTATFTDQSANFETDLALAGVTMVSMSISDTESDTPFSASLTGTNASDLQLKYVNSNSSSVGIQAVSNLSIGTYNYNVKVTDNFGKSTTYSGRSFTIASSADYGKTYLYRSNYGVGSLSAGSYLALMGASSVSGDTPPEVTGYTANATSPFRLISSSLGDSSLSLAGGGTATLVDTLSGSNLSEIISASSTYTVGGVSEQYIIIVPSGSDMTGIPTSMTDGFGDNTLGRYVMAINADGGGWGAEASIIHLLDTSGSFNGYDKHFVIGRTGPNAASSIDLRLIPASGSLPS